MVRAGLGLLYGAQLGHENMYSLNQPSKMIDLQAANIEFLHDEEIVEIDGEVYLIVVPLHTALRLPQCCIDFDMVYYRVRLC